jgi:hypothetical protein
MLFENRNAQQPPTGPAIVAVGADRALDGCGSSAPRGSEAPSQPGKPVMALSFRLLLKRALYLVAILLLPGALIAVALHWWLDRRGIRGNSPRPYD